MERCWFALSKESNESWEVVLSQRDLPLWARGATAALVLFATWWLLNTEVLRNAVGESIAILCLGVISVFILRGMHLPLAFWPDGPWRIEFSLVAVLLTALVVAGMLLIAGPNQPPVLASRIDPGTVVLVVTGTLVWGFACGVVRQRPFLNWYALAAAVALLPLVTNLLVSAGGSDMAQGVCILTAANAEQETGCRTAVLPTLVFLVAIGAGSKLITEEITFRRILIGDPKKAGLVHVAAAAAIAVAWFGVLAWAGIGTGETALLGGVAALTAGSIYVLSHSLMVSALYSAVFFAGYWAVVLSQTSGGTTNRLPVPVSFWTSSLLAGIVLALVVVRRNGLLGHWRIRREPYVTGD
jgi:heme/copper-type cytochrome/quinol oxidase subunit 4